ncbi:MAG: DUF4760 domain-containing protein [Pseudomonadota bacterium]
MQGILNMLSEFVAKYGPLIIVSGTAIVVITTITLNNINHNAGIKIRSFDVIFQWSQDNSIQKIFSDIRSVIADDKHLRYDPEDLDTKNAFLALMNFYESIAIGVKRKALDDSIIKDWWQISFIRHFTIFHAYLHQYRCEHGLPRAFRNAEDLAQRWRYETIS